MAAAPVENRDCKLPRGLHRSPAKAGVEGPNKRVKVFRVSRLSAFSRGWIAA